MNRGSLDDTVRDGLRGQVDGAGARVERAADRVWRRVETSIVHRGADLAGEPRPRSWKGIAAVFACLTIGLAFGAVRLYTATGMHYPPNAPLATADDYRRASQVNPSASLPAPQPFVPGFSVSADPVPASAGQGIEMKSARGWPGRRVWLYVAPSSEQYIIKYLRKLPRDAVLIGAVDIAQADGTWQMSWVIPDKLTREGTALDLQSQTVLYVVGVTDSGYLAAAGVEIGPKRTLGVTPQPAAPGDTLTVRGSDYPSNTRVRVDILHECSDGGTDLQVTLGWAMTSTSGAFELTYELPERLNWPFADSTGMMRDHWLTIGDAGTYRILTVEMGEIGPGATIQKLVQIGKP